MPAFWGGTTPIAACPIPGVAVPMPMPAMRKPSSRALTGAAEAEQDPDRDPVGELAGDRRGDEGEEGERQEAQARLQRREALHALQVDRQVEEHREHPRREPEGDGGDAVEGGFAEQAEVEHRVVAARLDRDEGEQHRRRADQRGEDLDASPAIGVAADQSEDEQEEAQ
jgi:hypothetical protein